jgi:DNA (cytosine-5)-methyltransferase 1
LQIGAVDLFCGIGGLTYGIQQTEIEVIAGIDIDNSCAYAFSRNNDCVFVNKNVNDVKGRDIKRLLRAYDIKIIIGCAPCQPFSSHQKDKLNRDKHKDWGLLNQYARIIRESKPHIVSMENVPELMKESVFTDFVQTLLELKYKVFYKVIDASDYGVPQRRKRLILLASRLGRIEIIKPTYIGNKIHVKDVIGSLPQISAGTACPTDRIHYAPTLSPKNILRIQASLPGGTWRDWPDELVVPCHKKEKGASYTSVYGRMKWDDVSPTVTTQFIGYGTGRFGHPEQDRSISLREGAMLQTFPRDYQFVPENEEVVTKIIAKHIGNAVPPRLGLIIGQSIMNNIQNWQDRKRKKV